MWRGKLKSPGAVAFDFDIKDQAHFTKVIISYFVKKGSTETGHRWLGLNTSITGAHDLGVDHLGPG